MKQTKKSTLRKSNKSSKSVTQLKKEADKYFSKYIRYRDSEGGLSECITCSIKLPPKQMQAGHFVSRGKNILRYDDENVNAQCLGCNMFKSGEQYLYSIALDKKYGDGTAQKLMAQRHEIKQFKTYELQEIIDNAKEFISWYESHNQVVMGR